MVGKTDSGMTAAIQGEQVWSVLKGVKLNLVRGVGEEKISGEEKMFLALKDKKLPGGLIAATHFALALQGVMTYVTRCAP